MLPAPSVRAADGAAGQSEWGEARVVGAAVDAAGPPGPPSAPYRLPPPRHTFTGTRLT